MKKKLFSLMLSTMLSSTYSAVAMMEEVEFTSTGVAQVFQRHPDRLEIVTDNNTLASYQGESNRYTVIPGQIVKVDYSIEVTQGIMSLGALNTHGNGWYANEKGDVWEIIRPVGSYNETIKWLVPENELETSLVLRNYSLKEEGESHFTVNKMRIKIKDTPSSKVQEFVLKMPRSVREIYEKPKNERAAYIDQTYPVHSEARIEIVESLINVMVLTPEATNIDPSWVKRTLRDLEYDKENSVLSLSQFTDSLQHATERRLQTEDAIKELRTDAEDSVCSFAPLNVSAGQLGQAKTAVAKYLEDFYNLEKRNNIIPEFAKGQDRRDQEAAKRNNLYDSFLENIRTILILERNAAILSQDDAQVFSFGYLELKRDHEEVLWKCNSEKTKVNFYQKLIDRSDSDIRDLEIPFLFYNDFKSIVDLLA